MRIEQVCNSPIQTFASLKPGTVYKASDGKIYIKGVRGDCSLAGYILDPLAGIFWGGFLNSEWESRTTVVEIYPDAKIVLKG